MCNPCQRPKGASLQKKPVQTRIHFYACPNWLYYVLQHYYFFHHFLLFLLMICLKMVLHTWSGHFLTYNLIYETWSRNYNFIWYTCNVISQYLGCKTVKNVLREGLQSYFFKCFCSVSLQKKLGQLDKAASAAHTYFQANPEHVEMGEDLEQYKAQKGVKEEDFIDREARPHQVSDCRPQLRHSVISWTFTNTLQSQNNKFSIMKCVFLFTESLLCWSEVLWQRQLR